MQLDGSTAECRTILHERHFLELLFIPPLMRQGNPLALLPTRSISIPCDVHITKLIVVGDPLDVGVFTAWYT